MTYAEASHIVQDYTGDNLLESLEQIQIDLPDGNTPSKVRAAYYTLMAGFTEMFAPKK